MLARLFVIGFGIAIIVPALIYNGVTTAYPAPKRTEFFPLFEAPLAATATSEERKARADQNQERQHAFEAAQQRFARVLLIAATAVGIACILSGSFIGSQAIGAGLMLGGTFAVAIGYWSYSSALDDWWRFGSLALGLAALLFVGRRQSLTKSHT